MKKSSLLVLLLLFMMQTIFAVPRLPGQPGVNPKDGGFGINMASRDYQGDKNDDVDNKEGFTYLDSPNGVRGDGSIKNYDDYQMIATGGVFNLTSILEQHWVGDWIPYPEWLWNNDDGLDYPMKVTIDCPNGFYFESISNPGVIRPFKLIVVVKDGYSNEDTMSNANTAQKGFTILDDNSITVEDIRYTNTRPDEDFTDPTELLYGYCSHQFLWFDLVLALPFDEVEGSSNYVSSNGRMSADGRYYDLVEADDYFALITVTVEWGENYEHSDMITIPLSGYYSRNEQADIDTTTSLYVDTLSSAANLNLATMAGQEIDVANVTFMSTSDSTNYSLFLSASRNPFYSDSNGFRFLHSSVSYGEVPTLEEYLGFNLYLTTTESTGGTSIGTVTSFTGEEAIEGTTLPDNAISIVPEKNTNTGSAEAYSQYSGRISLVMDSPQVTMKDGVYAEEVFIHIVTEESTTGGA